RVEEFDYESAARKQLRGNIYLAKVARIEPSLQAAFVNYGGNRHGFLAFAEIHPDYYQIPVAVREAMLKEDALDRQGSLENGDNGHSGESESREAAVSAGQLEEPAEPAPSELGEQRQPATEQEAAGAILPEAPMEPANSAGPDQAGARKPRDTLIPLEAALPAVIYEEFTAAVDRAAEAQDEIPAHPDDVETVADAVHPSPEHEGHTPETSLPQTGRLLEAPRA